MRALMMGCLAMGLLLTPGAPGATLDDPGFCGAWVEKNRSCAEDMQSACEGMVRQRFLEQAQTTEAEAQPELKAAIETRAAEMCPRFIAQITDDSALSVCETRSASDDPKARQQTERVVECLQKNSCAEYAACSISVK